MAARDERRAAEDDASCQSYGARPGTDAYIACRTAKAQTRAETTAMYAAANAARHQYRRPITCGPNLGLGVTCY